MVNYKNLYLEYKLKYINAKNNLLGGNTKQPFVIFIGGGVVKGQIVEELNSKGIPHEYIGGRELLKEFENIWSITKWLTKLQEELESLVKIKASGYEKNHNIFLCNVAGQPDPRTFSTAVEGVAELINDNELDINIWNNKVFRLNCLLPYVVSSVAIKLNATDETIKLNVNSMYISTSYVFMLPQEPPKKKNLVNDEDKKKLHPYSSETKFAPIGAQEQVSVELQKETDFAPIGAQEQVSVALQNVYNKYMSDREHKSSRLPGFQFIFNRCVKHYIVKGFITSKVLDYATGKLLGEIACQIPYLLHSESNSKCIIVRLPTMYGNGQIVSQLHKGKLNKESGGAKYFFDIINFMLSEEEITYDKAIPYLDKKLKVPYLDKLDLPDEDKLDLPDESNQAWKLNGRNMVSYRQAGSIIVQLINSANDNSTDKFFYGHASNKLVFSQSDYYIAIIKYLIQYLDKLYLPDEYKKYLDEYKEKLKKLEESLREYDGGTRVEGETKHTMLQLDENSTNTTIEQFNEFISDWCDSEFNLRSLLEHIFATEQQKYRKKIVVSFEELKMKSDSKKEKSFNIDFNEEKVMVFS